MGVVSGPRLVVDVMITVGRQAVVEVVELMAGWTAESIESPELVKDIGSSRREPRFVAAVYLIRSIVEEARELGRQRLI